MTSQEVPIGDLFDDFADEYLEVRDAVGWTPWPHLEAALGDASLEGLRVLDVGCGAGTVLDALLKRGATGVGLDASERMCELAAERLPGTPILWHDLEAGLPFGDASFDITLAMGCIEFVEDVERSCHELIRVTRPGGTLLFLVELCAPWLDGGASWSVELYEVWTRYRRPLEEVKAFAAEHLEAASVRDIPGYIQDESGLPVRYGRVIGRRPGDPG